MLTSRYERPQAYDLPDYMAATANLGAYMPANPFMGDGGLLYQPGTEQYADAYPINTGILEYQPPQFAVGPVQYHSPLFGHIEVSHPEEPEPSKEPPYDWWGDPEGRKSGDGGEFGIDGPAHGGWPAGTPTVGGLMPGEQGYTKEVAKALAAERAKALLGDDSDFGDATDYGDPGWGGEAPI